MTETEIADGPEALEATLRQRFNKLIEEGIITNEKVLAILNSLERDGKRRLKKDLKKKLATSERGREYCIKSVSGISYEQHEKVWGTWSHKEKNLPQSTQLTTNSIFSSSEYNFRKVYLRGLSVADMAKRFPGNNWGCHINDNTVNEAGAYLISLDNPLKNLPFEREKELQPADCYRLDFNLTVELLITLLRLGKDCPELYFRTTLTNGHRDEICVGLVDGKISFLSEEKVRVANKMGICLVKAEKWM